MEINSLKEGCIKLQRQKSAEDVVKRNLMGYYQDKKKKVDENFAQIKTKINSFETLFANFEGNLEIVLNLFFPKFK